MIYRKMIWLTVILALFMSTGGCKKSKEVKDVISKKTLTVQLETGVTGQPAAGSHSYDLNTSVSYSYSPVTGYENLQVKLNGSPVSASGTITMNNDYTLNALAQRRMYFNGNWLITIEWDPASIYKPENVYNMEAVCQQNGDDITMEIDNTLVTGKVNLEGDFEMQAEAVGNGVIGKFSFEGKVDIDASPLTLSGTTKVEFYLESNPNQLFSTATGTLSGKKSG